ncbi:alpha/beta-hydrolase [Hyaloscypha variabilis F]|uniref:Alpha/beta-hydrolase n=1 Tax=Hyaloscypha variabilis (strain UAMH 11265 / GT02V1 / F) TaxID=1149755 RepID=A0A2J6RSV6_HYAVF|nr:alpha/beta-hydrolase [Hyaloscypha variabilis F]
MTKPTIVLIPGLWEGPQVFTSLSTTLQALGYPTEIATLPSTGTTSSDPDRHTRTMRDDEQAIRYIVKRLVVNEKKTVIMVAHSAGGFLGAGAIQGLGRKSRKTKGERGGVAKIVFLSAGLAAEGYMHGKKPFMDFIKAKGEMHCVAPETTLFSDLSHDETQKWLQELKCQPGEGWDQTIQYCGWRDVPSVYLICDGDKCLPPPVQEQCAKLAGSEVVRCGAGHMVMLSMPEKVVEVVVKAAEGL